MLRHGIPDAEKASERRDMSETSGAVSGQKDKVSNGRHILRGLYEAKREKQLAGVGERAEARASRTPVEQLELLDQRLGVGIGAKVERAELAFLAAYGQGAPEDPAACEVWKQELNSLLNKTWNAKLEVEGYRIMRKLGLSPRTSEGHQVVSLPGVTSESYQKAISA